MTWRKVMTDVVTDAIGIPASVGDTVVFAPGQRVAKLPHPPEPRLGTDDCFAHLRPSWPLHGGREGDRHLR